MFLFQEPSDEVVRQFISSQARLPFSYTDVGATRGKLPAGYTVDRNRIMLGKGETVFERAVSALKRWKQFDLGWVTIVPAETTLEVDATVAIKGRTFGFWSLSASRVVYLIDEQEP